MRHISEDMWVAFRANPCDATFEPIYRLTSGHVYTLCRRILRNEEDAMDAMQATYARLVAYARDEAGRHNSIDTHADMGRDIECVVRRFTIREADSLRKRRGRRARKELAVETIAFIPDGKASPRTMAQQDQLRCKLEALVDQLGEEYRLPVLLHFFDGMTHAEIADTLDVPRSTVTQRLARAIRRLEPLARRAGLGQSAAALTVVAAGASLMSPPMASAKVFAAAKAASVGMSAGAAAAATAGHGGYAVLGLSGGKFAAAVAAGLVAVSAAVAWAVVGLGAPKLPLGGDPASQNGQTSASAAAAYARSAPLDNTERP